MYLVAYEDLEGRMHASTFDTLEEANEFAELVGGSRPVRRDAISEEELRKLVCSNEEW